MTSGVPFWMWLAGLVYLVLGLISVRKDLGVLALGRVFTAVALAMFGAEHFAGANFIMQGVPRWMPGHLFWTYLVGCALLATATSLVAKQYMRLSTTMVGLMMFLFVLMLHLPKAIENPKDRFAWAVATREIAFTCGVWIFAGRFPNPCRVVLGAVLLFFGVEHFLHPDFMPGVPLGKLMPAWIPVRPVWGYITGLALVATGGALLVNKQARTAASALGVVLILMVIGIYLPVLAKAPAADLIEALNYIGDTTLFAGTILLAVGSLKRS